MLPAAYQAPYENFRDALHQLRHQVTQANPDAAALQTTFLDVQQGFQQKLMGIESADLEASTASYVRSLHTEINKHLRLLGMDLSFFQAARHSTTGQQRQAQMRDRVDRLIGYCDALLKTADPEV